MPSAFRLLRRAPRLVAAAALLIGTHSWALFPSSYSIIQPRDTSAVATQNISSHAGAAEASASALYQGIGLSVQYAAVNAAYWNAVSSGSIPGPGVTGLPPVIVNQMSLQLSGVPPVWPDTKVFGNLPRAASPGSGPARSDAVPTGPGLAAEGFLPGFTAVPYDIGGIDDSAADLWVLADQGFDYFRDNASGYYVFLPARLRTVGASPVAITDFAVVVSDRAAQERLASVLGAAAAPMAQGGAAAEPLPDVYFYLRDADGVVSVTSGFFSASPVPEPATATLLGGVLLGALLRRRAAHWLRPTS